MKNIFKVSHFQKNILRIFAGLFLFTAPLKTFGDGIGNGSSGSPSISGIINTYASVININTTSCASSVTVLSSVGFSAGDLVLIIQMEGATINTTNTPSYGTILNYNNAGNFEYTKVFSVTGNVIQTIAPLSNNYDITGVIQLIRVPQYNSPTISGVLTCPAWNGLSGGIIVLDATGTVTMNANIDASSKGFRGGLNHLNIGFPVHFGDYYLQDADSGGYKGEGIASYFIAPNIYGRGAAANGGGGGNNHNAGGGGGSNSGCGGNGGYGLPDPYYGPNYTIAQGIGGYALSNSGSPFKIFLGGGGGAGHQNDGSNAAGGNGGGIIIISANFVSGNARTITSFGASTPNTYRDGAGGAGAGGTVLLNCSVVNSTMSIDVHGGNGGNVSTGGAPNHGPGGGGGGGLIVTTSAGLPANVTITSINGGTGGLCNGISNHGTANGCIGNTSFNLVLPQETRNPTTTTSRDTAFCNNGALILTATPSNSYSWTPAAGLSCVNCQSPVATVSATTIYISTGYISSCMYIDSFTVTINPLPNVTLNNFIPVCEDASSFSLSGGNPIGGNYFGTGVSTGNFNPSIAGVGVDTIFYTYTDVNGCSDTTSKNITINVLPVVTQSAINDVCIDAPAFALSGGNPNGGTYSGVGVNASNFDPAIAGAGLKTITYFYTNANGCSNADSTTITVNALPIVTLTPLGSICEDASAFALSGGNPAGGTYSGAGVNAGNFDPAIAGVGVHTITYSYTDVNSCSNTKTKNITVNALPNITLVSFNPVCVDAPSFALSGGNPLGGNYSGNGVSANNFDPSIGGAGVDTIFYSYTGANGCSNDTSKNIVVNALPVVTLGAINPVCFASTTFNLTTGNPVGGIYSGVGVSAGNFNPAIAGIGTHKIYYSYSDANSCSNMDSTTITVYALPNVIFSTVNSVCDGTPAFALMQGSPGGGTYSGVGIAGNNFDPLIAGVGTQTITYSFIDANGCGNSAQTNITVNALPNVTLSSFNPVCVDASSFALSGGNPIGGSYSGTGVSVNNFVPSVAGVGTHAITYSFSDVNGCSNNATKNITVNALPIVTFGAINPVCIASAAFNLTSGNPAGGIYSGVGVSAGSFNPSIAGIGMHKIYYSYNDVNSCSNIDSTTITVYNLPNVTFATVNPVCDGTLAFTLTQGSPIGGTYSGVGVVGNNFDPSIAGIGTQTITYSYTDANGCGNSAQTNISINALPNVTLSSFNSVCVNAPSFALSGGNPTGGNYSGVGVSANNFDPSIAGFGIHAITYTYSDANGCSNSAVKNIITNPLPVVTLGTINPVCIASATFNLTTGNPAGGTYSGVGVNAGSFNPSIAGIGMHKIYYSYNDANSCSNIDSTTVTVYDLPVVTFTTVNPVCDGTAAFALTQGSPVGGNYSGVGVVGNNFDPSVSGIGTQTITYSYTDANGCGNSAQTNITVNALPNVTLNNFNSVCVDAPPFPLSGGNPAGGSYSGSGVSINSFDPSLSGVGVHTITYSYTDANGCNNSSTKNIIVNPLIFLNAGADDTICAGENITLNATGANNVNWNPSTTLSCANCINPIATPSSTITYIVSSPLPCSKNDTVTINVVPAVTVDAGGDTTVCYGSSAQLNASSNYTSFSWNTSTNLSCINCSDPIATPAASSTYFVTVTNGICSASDEVTVNVNHVVVDAGLDVTIVNGETIQLNATGANTYSWTPEFSLNNSTIASPIAFPSITTVYKVTGYADGCSDSDSVIVNVMNIGDAIFIPSAFTPDNDGKNDLFLAVHAGKFDSFEMKIYNRWGKLIYESDDINKGWDGTVNGDRLPEGSYIYFIRLLAEKNIVTRTGNVNLIR